MGIASLHPSYDKYDFAISRHDAPEVRWKIFAPSKTEGAGKTGCALHPRSRVQLRTENAHTSIQVQRKHSGLPCAGERMDVESVDKSTQCDCCVHICVAIRC